MECKLGTEIGEMTRKLFTGFSKSHPWMLNTADRMAAHRRLNRHRDDLCGANFVTCCELVTAICVGQLLAAAFG